MELKTIFVNNNSDMECLDTISKSLPSELLEKAIDKSKLVQKEIIVQTKHGPVRRKQWMLAGEEPKQTKPSKKQDDDLNDFTKFVYGTSVSHEVHNIIAGLLTRIGKPTPENIQLAADQALSKYKELLEYPVSSTGHRMDLKVINARIKELEKYASKSTAEEPKDTKPSSSSSSSSVDFSVPSHGDIKRAVIELTSKHSKADIMSAAKQQGITWKPCEKEGVNWMRASMAIQKAMKNGTIGKTNETSKVDEKKPTAKKVENNSLSPKVFSEDGRVTSVTGGGSRGQLNIVRRGKSEYIMVQSTKKDGTFGKPMRVTLYGNETPQKALERMKSNNPDKQWRFDPDSLEPKKADDKPKYTEHPTTKEELKNLIKKAIEEHGNNADLNHIDTSKITDMDGLFYNSDFNGDISKWDVSNVIDMRNMFERSKFNGDISKWDVSGVVNMRSMFDHSDFNGDISKWDVSGVVNMDFMFYDSKFSGDISKWNPKSVRNYSHNLMFSGSPLAYNVPKWYLR